MGSSRSWLRVVGPLLVALVTLGATARAQAPAIVRPDIEYAQINGKGLLLDVYFSPLAEQQPVLMLIHGGSWRHRDKSDWRDLAPSYVEAGYTVVVPNYRLAPPGGGSRFPAPVNDLSAALAWTRANADDYAGDPSRVGMLGTSAGGHLALMSGVTGKDRPEAVGAYSPPVSLRRLYQRGVLWYQIKNFLGCLPLECPRTYRVASPLTGVDRGTPPVFMAYSREEQIPEGQGRLMRKRLSDNGLRSTLHVVDGKAHGLPLARKMLDETIRFFNRHL